MITTKELNFLKQKAKEIRIDVLKSISEAGSGHTGGSLSSADIFTALYFNLMNYRADNPKWENRDKLVLSIGHIAPLLYASLAHAGFFSKDELLTLRKLGSRLQGHPGKDHGLPGIELSAGSLGQGLSVAVGMALANKIDKKQSYIYCINGDGELQEGSIWEAAMSASHHKLDNLISIVDRNFLQIDGSTSDVMQIEPLDKKWEAFGWQVFECDGHDIQEIIETVNKAKQVKNKPSVIIAKTIMGKGIKQIENNHLWHGKAPSKEELAVFIDEIKNPEK
jgi:transketolase